MNTTPESILKQEKYIFSGNLAFRNTQQLKCHSQLSLACENFIISEPDPTDLTLRSIITPLTPLKYNIFENIMKNGAFAPLDQILHFP